MAVYTTKVRARPRPQRTTIRKRLKGLTLASAQNARRHLSLALGRDQKAKNANPDVAAVKLIFMGDAKAEAKAGELIDILDEAISSKLKTVTTR